MALHQLFEGRRWRGRRIEHRKKLLVALGIKEESSLIEDSRFGLPPRAGEHELGQLLPAQRSGTGEQRLELCGSPDLNDVILARGRASVRTSLCHISKLLGAIWSFATTLSIHSRGCRHSCSRARLMAVAILAAAPSAHGQNAGPANAVSKQGYWWYEAPKAQAEPEPEALVKPVIPPMAELATWTPPKIRKLIEEQRDYAATVLTVEAVADFWRLQDFARRKARAFAGVTQLAMLQHPELNSKSADPMVGDARSELAAQKDAIRRSYLRSHAGEFALVMFSRSTCGYCRVQWPIIQRFQEETGWQVTLMDIDKRPEVRERFGVEITPTTMVIRRSSQQRMIIASGVEAYPNLVQMAYQAVRLLRGDIRPEQFMTGPGEDAGFFDALGNGPVSATDPRALGGDLITASGEPQP
ncbi:conjugal transfer pilus assembly protein TraF [Sphingobium scionense]|uniref:Conjugal transfer pilus assembly protein TraF n=2 Tax=Sphingobium TaxID=165695 RepID=A0A7W6LVT2_9SPHN|nr:conjugal transfer pilus assembly protein TraF [Sphingobium scionense]